jgi:hypothetical protein
VIEGVAVELFETASTVFFKRLRQESSTEATPTATTTAKASAPIASNGPRAILRSSSRVAPRSACNVATDDDVVDDEDDGENSNDESGGADGEDCGSDAAGCDGGGGGPTPDQCTYQALRRLFGAQIIRTTLDRQWVMQCPAFADRVSTFPGMRVLTPEILESVISFVGSANNSIKRNSKMLHSLCSYFPENRVGPLGQSTMPAAAAVAEAATVVSGNRDGGKKRVGGSSSDGGGGGGGCGCIGDSSSGGGGFADRSWSPHVPAGEMNPTLMRACAMYKFPTVEQLASVSEQTLWELGK